MRIGRAEKDTGRAAVPERKVRDSWKKPSPRGRFWAVFQVSGNEPQLDRRHVHAYYLAVLKSCGGARHIMLGVVGISAAKCF
jgi:hypothetical protein